MARKLIVEIIGDSRSLERSFARSSKAGRQFGVSMGGVGRSIAGVTAAFAGAAGLTAVVRAAFSEMAEANKVAAQTQAVLKSTGNVAGVTAAQIDDLADSIMRKTGIDDEQIKSAENLLLTFTNVRNVVGEGNDVFNQATQAIVDMSAVQGDLESNTKAIGKALQDPIRGVTALRRVGVALTVQQEKQIKTLVRHGRVLDAQKIILAELRTEFEGQAEAVGRTQPWNRLRETVTNVAGEMAQRLLPAINRIVDRLQAWFDNASNVQRIHDRFNSFVATLENIANRIRDVNDALGGWRNTLTILAGLWVGFKVAAITSTTAVLAANVYAAAGTAAAWRAALISTGWGAFAVAAGLAATYVITHWEKVKDFFRRFVLFMEYTGNQAALAFLEPFSHLPWKAGGWARGAKEAILQNLAGIDQDMAAIGQDAGEAFTKGVTLGAGPGMSLERTGGAAPPVSGLGPAGGGKTAAERAAERREAAERAAAKRRALAERLRQQTETKMGWLEFAVERAEATKTVRDDVKAFRAIEQFLLERIRQEGRTLDLVRELWRTRQRIRDANKAAAGDGDPLAGLVQVSSKKLAGILGAGLGLGGADRRTLMGNISGAQLQPMYIGVNIDGREVGRATTKAQTRTGKRTAKQTSGRRD